MYKNKNGEIVNKKMKNDNGNKINKTHNNYIQQYLIKQTCFAYLYFYAEDALKTILW